jgi:hypothetical protein
MKIKTLEIKNPCSQKWDEMEPMAQGRYCKQCNHLIRDFSAMDDEALVNMLQSGIYSCGMFSTSQMGTVYQLNENKQQRKKYWTAMAASLVAGAFQIATGYSQTTDYTRPLNKTYTKVRTDQEPVVNNQATSTVQKTKFSFRVVDVATRQPLAKVKVEMMGNTYTTDSTGRLDVELNYTPDTLVSFYAELFLHGYEPEKIKLTLQACYNKLKVLYLQNKKTKKLKGKYSDPKILGWWG